MPQALHSTEEITRETTSPLVHWKVLQTLEWPSRESPQPELRKRADEIIAGVPYSFHIRLTRALANDTLLENRPALRGDGQDWEERVHEREKLDNEFRASVSAECATNLKGEDLFAAIDRCLRGMTEAGLSSWPNHLLFELGKGFPDAAERVTNSILASPNTPLAQFFHVILAGIDAHSKETLATIVQKAHSLGNPTIQRALAQH